MATATPAAAAEAPAPASKAGGKKKLLILIAAAVLLLLIAGGGAALLLMKKKAADSDDDEAEAHAPAATASAKVEARHGTLPMFLPLEAFTVNLADRDAERYVQLGLTLEVDDNKTSDQLKAYMPAIRNNILLLLSNKTSAELLTHDGKLKLAAEIRREALKPLGIAVVDDGAADAGRKRGNKAAYPIRAVHFSNIIVQ